MLTEQICELIIGLFKMIIIFIICLKFNLVMGILMIVFDIIHIKILNYYNKNITNCEDFYHKNICVVFQKPFLFNMSIKDNLLLVNNNFDEIIKVCKETGIHEKIMKLEQGYDTFITKDGNNISGGEKQLICLARSLLLKPKILILDEINNSLDVKVQNDLLELLVNLKKECTIILISHNNQFINISDKVIEIDKNNN